MPTFGSRRGRAWLLAIALALGAAQAVQASSRQLAPGFTSRPAGSSVVVLPADMELFSISAGGVIEPRADWTTAAHRNFVTALEAQRARLGAGVTRLEAAEAEDFHEITALHRAVAAAITLHHRNGNLKLPTKGDRLDWSLGEAVRPLRERTGADYALFTWVRDSYASTERKAVMLGMALLGAVTLPGEQEGYASLVDLNTGRVVWFNKLSRMWGDLREPRAANETIDALLRGFPEIR